MAVIRFYDKTADVEVKGRPGAVRITIEINKVKFTGDIAVEDAYRIANALTREALAAGRTDQGGTPA